MQTGKESCNPYEPHHGSVTNVILTILRLVDYLLVTIITLPVRRAALVQRGPYRVALRSRLRRLRIRGADSKKWKYEEMLSQLRDSKTSRSNR